MRDATFSTLGGYLARLELRGGSKPWAVEVVPVCNFVPLLTGRRMVGDVAFVTVEGIQHTPSGTHAWRHEIPERILTNPQALQRALRNSLGATGIIWVGQSGHFARFLVEKLEELSERLKGGSGRCVDTGEVYRAHNPNDIDGSAPTCEEGWAGWEGWEND